MMKLKSSAFFQGGKIPSVYTCEGMNINPPLEIEAVPEGAKSLVLLMDDPDVPAAVRADQMWDHWVVYNMPPKIRAIGEGKGALGVMGKATGGTVGYEGPCPPDREHRYFFKLFALDRLLDLPKGASKKEVLRAMQGHVLATAELMGRYEKKR